MNDTFNRKLATLDTAARQALETVATYYRRQLRSELQDGTAAELATALSETRQALDCRVLAAELDAQSQARLLVAYRHATPVAPSEKPADPDQRVAQVEAVLRDTAVELFKLLASDEEDAELPDYEQMRSDDRIAVRDPDGSDLNGRTGTFRCYTDPRIEYEARLAQVHLDGEPEEELTSVRPALLEFAPEEEVLRKRQRFRPVYDSEVEHETYEQQHAAGHYNPALVLTYSLNGSGDGERHRVTLLAGNDDDLEVFTDGWSVYVLTVNARAGHAGLEVFVGAARSDDHFYQGGCVEHELGDDFYDLGAYEQLERILWVTSDYLPRCYEQNPPLVFGRFESLGAWRRSGIRLELYDTFHLGHLGKSVLAYRLYDEDFQCGRTPVFQGADFCCSPLHAIDSDATAASLLSFLSLQPGDTDTEHFEPYTPEQLEWCQVHGENVVLVAEYYQQRQEWKDLHSRGHTDEVVLAIAYHGYARELLDVLDLEIEEACAVVEKVSDANPENEDLRHFHRSLLELHLEETRCEELIDRNELPLAACNSCGDVGGLSGDPCGRDLSEENEEPPETTICCGSYAADDRHQRSNSS